MSNPRPWLDNYPAGVAPEIDLQEFRSIVSVLESSCKRFRERPAFRNFGTTISYGDLDRMSSQFAAYLAMDLKLKKGDRIALMMPNLLQYPIAIMGALRAGLIVVNTNPLYTARELRHQLKDSGAKAIVVMDSFAHTVAEVLPDTEVKQVIVTGVGDMLSFPKGMIINFVRKYIKREVPDHGIAGAIGFEEALRRGRRHNLPLIDIAAEDIAFLQYTGGTTGLSKGAMLTHRNLVANMQQSSSWIGAQLRPGQEIIITALPLYHIFSLSANCLSFMKIGGLNHLITNPRDMPGFVRELKTSGFTCITGVNTLFNGLLNTPGFDQLDFSKLHMTLGGGMAVQRAVAENWKKVTGCTLVEAYGLTETSPAACINPLDMKEYNGAIGMPVPSTDACVKDEEGRVLPMGEVGELCIKGPQVMLGYWQREEETDNAIDVEGWLRTGDMARMDEKGYFFLVDRKKDMILVSGFNVYPNEVEDVVAMMPGVLEVAAVGVPDEKSGEAVKIVVVKKDPSLTTEAIKAFCKENLTGYKLPKVIEFRAELPKTNVGKILRRELRDPPKAAP